jgi:PAS domain S-box-containing protein
MKVTDRRKFEKSLFETHDLYQRIIETTTEGIWVLDENHCTSFVNQAMAQMMGYTAEEMIGTSVFDYVLPEDIEEGKRALERRRSGRSEYGEWRVKHRDGRAILVGSSATPLLDKEGAYRGSFAMSVDISQRKQMENKLCESEGWLATALDAAQMGIWVWNKNTQTLLCSDTLKRLWGYEPSEWKNSVSQFWDRLHPEDRQAIEQIRDQAWTTGLFEVEYRVIWPDHSLHWIYAKGQAQFETDGEAYRYTGTAMDITQRKQWELALRRSQATLKAIIDNTPAVIYMKDRKSRLILANQGLEKLLGAREEELLGKSDYDFWAKEYADKLRENDLKVFESGQSLKTEEIIPAEGVQRTYIVHKFPLYIEGHDESIVCGISMDITEQKESENALRTLSAELQRSNRELEQFASVASHDLKEPIRMVNSYLQLLSKKVWGQLDETSRGYLTFALDSSKRMCDLVDSLLKYAKLGSKRLDLEAIEVNSLLRDVIENLGSMIRDAKAEIQFQGLPTIRADRIQLAQLFQNLISNGLKFSRKDQAPRVRITSQEAKDGWTFAVEDNGIGIEPEYRGEIFDIFRRLHPQSDYPGEGIGLATCKRIAERHGGRIWVEASSLGGASFSFRLPK